MTIPCLNCGRPAETMRHDFAGGAERWSIVAPLYFLAHGRGSVGGFCSAACSLAFTEKQRAAA